MGMMIERPMSGFQQQINRNAVQPNVLFEHDQLKMANQHSTSCELLFYGFKKVSTPAVRHANRVSPRITR